MENTSLGIYPNEVENKKIRMIRFLLQHQLLSPMESQLQ